METTTTAIPADVFRASLKLALDEAFENVHGFFLDKGDSLFETLASITAEEASQPLGPRSGNIAAKVNHIRFYLDAIAANAAAGTYVPADWDSSWQVGEVTGAERQDPSPASTPPPGSGRLRQHQRNVERPVRWRRLRYRRPHGVSPRGNPPGAQRRPPVVHAAR